MVRAGRAEGLRLLSRPEPAVRVAGIEDTPAAARLLDRFNREFDTFTPGVAALTRRLAQLLAEGRILILLGGDGPAGVAQLRFYPSIWVDADDAVLDELFVVGEQRGRGIGRALLEAAIAAARERRAAMIEVGTSESDTAAIALYESAGFSNLEGGPGGSRMLHLERELS